MIENAVPKIYLTTITSWGVRCAKRTSEDLDTQRFSWSTLWVWQVCDCHPVPVQTPLRYPVLEHTSSRVSTLTDSCVPSYSFDVELFVCITFTSNPPPCPVLPRTGWENENKGAVGHGLRRGRPSKEDARAKHTCLPNALPGGHP